MNTLSRILLNIIYWKIKPKLLLRIPGKNLNDTILSKTIEKYWEKRGMNRLIYNNDIQGVKYLVEKIGVDIAKNDNYAMKWAKLCNRQNIVEYFIKKGLYFDIQIETCKKLYTTSTGGGTEFITTKLRPINIDHVRKIKYISVNDMKYWDGCPYINLETNIWRNFFSQRDNIDRYYESYVLIRNLCIKCNEKIRLVVMCNGNIIFRFNSNEILKEIIPIKIAQYSSFSVGSFFDDSGNNTDKPHEIKRADHDKYTVSFDIGFITNKARDFLCYFRYNTDIPLNIPENCSPPFDIYERVFYRDKLTNMMMLSCGMLLGGFRDNVIRIDYIDYIEKMYGPKKFKMQLIGEYQPEWYFKSQIVEYGKLCFPHDVF
jgi:hypothetical protein